MWAKDYLPSEIAENHAAKGPGLKYKKTKAGYEDRAQRLKDVTFLSPDQEWSWRRRVLELTPIRLENGDLTRESDRKTFSHSVDLKTLKAFYLSHAVPFNVIEEMYDRERKVSGSDFDDWGHLVALPYVDLFTCDKYTHSVLQRMKYVRYGSGSAFRSIEDTFQALTKG